MTLPSLKVCRRIRQLFRSIGDPNVNVAAGWREKLVALLTKHSLSWNDIPDCIAEATPLTPLAHPSRQRPPLLRVPVPKKTCSISSCT